ncbi:hypothetical protein AVEN_70619-1 [Araneus ventricosus]|uniref:Uncharacterized protein n=1 Tax=Araneus ventricosus TaxID=182803 RepID=A0A4Y2FBG7_ARAVE|nr:hypothetical protein AVEN_70619-1 [Araneus ventricosus]
MDLVILARDQMTRTTLETDTPSLNFFAIPAGGRLTQVRFNAHQASTHSGSSMEPGLKSPILKPNAVTRPLRPKDSPYTQA